MGIFQKIYHQRWCISYYGLFRWCIYWDFPSLLWWGTLCCSLIVRLWKEKNSKYPLMIHSYLLSGWLFYIRLKPQPVVPTPCPTPCSLPTAEVFVLRPACSSAHVTFSAWSNRARMRIRAFYSCLLLSWLGLESANLLKCLKPEQKIISSFAFC